MSANPLSAKLIGGFLPGLALSLVLCARLPAQSSGNPLDTLTGGQPAAEKSAAASDAARDDTAAKGPDRPLERADVEADRAALADELAATRELLAKAESDAAAAKSVAAQVTLLERLDGVYAEQLRTLQHRADLEAEAAEVDVVRERRQPPAAVLPPERHLALLDQLYEREEYLTDAEQWLERDVDNATGALGDARDEYEAREEARRRVRDLAKNEQTGVNPLRLAELESRLARETLRWRQLALDTLKRQQALIAPQRDVLEPQLAWLRANVVVSPEQVAQEEADRAEREATLNEALAEAQAQADEAAAVLRRIAETAGLEDEVVDLRRDARRVADRRVGLITRQLQRLSDLAGVREQRREVLKGETDHATLEAWADRNRLEIGSLKRQRTQHVAELVRARQQARDTEIAVAGEGADAVEGRREAREALREALVRWTETADVEVMDLDRMTRERERLQRELGEEVSLFSWPDLWRRTRTAVSDVWSHELFIVNDQPVRVRTLLWVALLVLGGVVLSHRLSRTVGGIAAKQLRWTRGRRAAWQTLLFYGLLALILYNVFAIFNLSLTQFSVVSGALAVGIGFGSQNLINNFISGIILLIERPVSEGDLIELDGQQLWVERIGMRSTIVRSFDNTNIVVPNSRLLEQPVINWTLSDDIVRLKIKVGVAYGSDTRKVERVLNELLRETKVVLPDPEPLVLFEAFGDNALAFEAIFHTRIEDRFAALTGLRHAIAERFAAEDITLAFPQRDVHLDTRRPLEINLRRSRPDDDAAVRAKPAAGENPDR